MFSRLFSYPRKEHSKYALTDLSRSFYSSLWIHLTLFHISSLPSMHRIHNLALQGGHYTDRNPRFLWQTIIPGRIPSCSTFWMLPKISVVFQAFQLGFPFESQWTNQTIVVAVNFRIPFFIVSCQRCFSSIAIRNWSFLKWRRWLPSFC
jgi:hypothetical protein